MSDLATTNGAWLSTLESARRVLAQVETVDEATHLVGAAETAKVYARNVLRSREAANHASHVSLLCQRRAGELLAAQRENGQRARSGKESHLATLDSLGVKSDDSSRWQRVARIPETTFAAHVARVTGRGDELTTAGLLRAVGSVVQSSETNEWHTPAVYVEAARRVLGGIDLDPASCDEANETVRADTFHTAGDDGLEHAWKGTVWLNPPYGRLAGSFVAG